MTRENGKMAPALWTQPPLPGYVRVITLQLNATYYREPGTCRWVGIIRDPEGNVELGRVIGPVRADDQEALDALLSDVGVLIEAVDYQLTGTVDDLKQALQEDPPPPATSRGRSKASTAST